MWSACSMLVSGINTWPPTGSGRSSASDSEPPVVVTAIHSSGKRTVLGFIVLLYQPKALSRNIYHDHFEGKINQGKLLCLTMILVSSHWPEATPPLECAGRPL